MQTETLLPSRYRRGIVLTFFALLLGLGLSLVRDYGVSTDEGTQRVIGQVSLLYVFQMLPQQIQQKLVSPQAAAHIAEDGKRRQLYTFEDRDYGVIFELPVAAVEQVFHMYGDEHKVFLMRHIFTLLVCYLGLIAFYNLVKQRFNSWRWGLLGTLLLVLSPRQFADYFYNDKDGVFMALFTIAVATAVPFIRRPTWRTALWHALACAIAIDARVMGILVPAATLAFVGLRGILGNYKKPATAPTGGIVGPLGVYLVAMAVLVVAFWPYLWGAPVAHLVEAFENMSHFRWPGYVLYQGDVIKATQLPWHYSLVWIGITVPIVYLVLFGLGLAGILTQALRRVLQIFTDDADWQDLLFLGLGLAPIASVIVLHSVLYNAWRQLYFIYPMLLLVAIRGLAMAWYWRPTSPVGNRFWQPALGLAMGLSLVIIGVRMVRLHPFEHVYFNAFAPRTPERYFVSDYWNLSYRQALEWIAAHDNRPHIRLYCKEYNPLELARLNLPAAARNRMGEVLFSNKPEESDYVVANYYYQFPQPYPLHHIMWADGVRMVDIYKVH
ncbi:MAG: hypothetical protein ACRYG7_30655 [Janthinobacterium lividum]